jgi:hypothetical protein
MSCGSAPHHRPNLPVASGAIPDHTARLPVLSAAELTQAKATTRPVTAERREGCLISEAWTAIGTSSDGHRLLLNSKGDFGLNLRYAGSATRETRDSVEIGVYQIILKHGDGIGVSSAKFLPVLVTLNQPLGHRQLLHAAVTEKC